MTTRGLRRCVIAFAALGLAAASCGGDDDGGTSTRATLVLNWTPNAHHLGIYAAERLGWYDDAGIDLRIVEPTEVGAERPVGTGDAAFGISVAEAVLPARAEGVPIVSIAALLPVNDSALMALAEEGVTGPGDLAGRTYGGYGGPLETELIGRLVACGGGDPSTVEHVEVGNVDYLAGLEADRFDFVWIFSGWDALRATEIEGADVSLVRFEDHFDCIPNWYTPVVITNESMIEDSPDVVRAFLEATARGYELAMDDPQRAADLMLELVPEGDADLLHAAADYYASRFAPDGRWGLQEREVWAEFEEFLRDAGLLDERVDVDDAFDDEMLPE
jgi:ABC-type nitrate/sulfonate/bicarbonate transport system substrate-binding protein